MTQLLGSITFEQLAPGGGIAVFALMLFALRWLDRRLAGTEGLVREKEATTTQLRAELTQTQVTLARKEAECAAAQVEIKRLHEENVRLHADVRRLTGRTASSTRRRKAHDGED